MPKHQRRFADFDERIIAMYGRGMSVRDIQAHLRELYGVEVGHDLISRVTDAVLDDVKAWQSRPLEDVYPRSGSGLAFAQTYSVPALRLVAADGRLKRPGFPRGSGLGTSQVKKDGTEARSVLNELSPGTMKD